MDKVNKAIADFHSQMMNGDVRKLSPEEVKYLPKQYLMLYGKNQIYKLWNILPIHLQEDMELQWYRPCFQHNYNEDWMDHFDGPRPLRIDCTECREYCTK